MVHESWHTTFKLFRRNDHQGAEEVESDETRTPHMLVHVLVHTLYFTYDKNFRN